MSEFRGIDVSHWQGAIDWAKVRAAGIQFAIIKAGGSDAGFYTDPRWEENYRGAKANPVYIDVEATAPATKAGATAAAIAFCRALESAGYFAGIYSST